MQSVSADYKIQGRQALRNPSYIKILFKMTDPDAEADASVTDNGKMYWVDDPNRLVDEYDAESYYLTLEHNLGVLNGSFQPAIPEGQPQVYQGFTGSEISDSFGNWIVNPTVTINFPTFKFEFIGLTITFDKLLGNYPETFNIRVYKDDILVQSIHCEPTSPELVITERIVECNKLEFEAIKSTIPHRRFRLNNITLGLMKLFTENEITTAKYKHEVDIINAKLPTHTVDYTILDKDREYDPENVTGMYSYIEAKQECKVRLGYELNNGSIEWVQMGKMYTTGNVDIETNATLPLVNFKTQSLLAFLSNKYKKGKYYPSGRTLYDLANDILMDANLPLDSRSNPLWILDDTLKNYTTSIPLPVDNMNVLLQEIANAGMCMLAVNRDGYITIKPKNESTQDFGYTLQDITTPPSTKKYPVLQGVDTLYTTLSVSSEDESLGEFDIIGASSTLYELSYDTGTNIYASVDSGLTIVGTPVYYARTCFITLTGTGKLDIRGNRIAPNEVALSVEFNADGERCPITNRIINSREHATQYATWVGEYVSRRIEYSFEDRGFPELDCGDAININTLYTDNVLADIMSIEITYNGAISGKTKLLQK